MQLTHFTRVITATEQDSGSGVLMIAIIVLGILYFLPTVVANVRKVPNRGSVMVINVCLGWTLVGWVVAMAMAARSQAAPPVVHNTLHLPQGYVAEPGQSHQTPTPHGQPNPGAPDWNSNPTGQQ